MATHVERFPAKRVPTKAWIGIGAVIVLLMAIGGGILIGRATIEEPAPPPEPMALAPDKFVATIDANIAALNAGDGQAYAATWGEGGEFGGESGIDFESYWEGRSMDPTREQWRLERTSEVIFVPRTPERLRQNGPYAAHTFSCVNADPDLTYTGIAVYRMYGEGKIVRQWVMNSSRKYLGGCY